ncbi:MAG: ABC transporter ATP-binding protein [Lachnospiraceae bacterium]
MDEIMKLVNINKTFWEKKGEKVMAVKDFTADFERGKMYAIMGKSGAGKTTVLSIMGFMDSATSGDIYLEGKKTEQLSKNEMADIRMKKIGFVFQNYFLNPKLTAEDNVILALKANKNVSKAEYRNIAEELLGRFHMESFKDKYPDKLSGGEQQRVCIARALANNPELILADEPTGNLDEENEKTVMEYLKGLTKIGKTVVMVTHSNEAKKYADKVYYMESGMLQREEEQNE